jgi:hypothetical protein
VVVHRSRHLRSESLDVGVGVAGTDAVAAADVHSAASAVVRKTYQNGLGDEDGVTDGRAGVWTWHLTASTVASRYTALARGWDMPKFMDFHDGLKLSSADIEQLRSQTQAGTTDEYGFVSWSSTTTMQGRCIACSRALTRTQYGGTMPPSRFPAGRSTGLRPYFERIPDRRRLHCQVRDLVLRDLVGGGGPGEREGMVMMLVFGEPVGGSTAATQTARRSALRAILS